MKILKISLNMTSLSLITSLGLFATSYGAASDPTERQEQAGSAAHRPVTTAQLDALCEKINKAYSLTSKTINLNAFLKEIQLPTLKAEQTQLFQAQNSVKQKTVESVWLEEFLNGIDIVLNPAATATPKPEEEESEGELDDQSLPQVLAHNGITAAQLEELAEIKTQVGDYLAKIENLLHQNEALKEKATFNKAALETIMRQRIDAEDKNKILSQQVRQFEELLETEKAKEQENHTRLTTLSAEAEDLRTKNTQLSHELNIAREDLRLKEEELLKLSQQPAHASASAAAEEDEESQTHVGTNPAKRHETDAKGRHGKGRWKKNK